MDPAKVEAVEAWPKPRSVRALSGFLGLAGYYRKFIQDYRVLSAPLTKLVKKEGFMWSSGANAAFCTLKQGLAAAPVLQLPHFDSPFLVDCDASGMDFEALVHQGAYLLLSSAGRWHHAMPS